MSQMMSPEVYKVRLYLIRHGQSEGNVLKHTIRGQDIPSPLTPLGFQQATLLGKRLKYENIKFDYMFCSTAIRTIQTATTALNIMNADVSKLIKTSALLEQSQGKWEGLDRTSSFILEAIREIKRLGIEFCAPEGESLRMVQNRAIGTLEPCIQQAKQESVEQKREIFIGIFGHGGLIQSLLQYFLKSNIQDAWLIQQNNTAINEILLNENGVSLVKVNDYGHLWLLLPETENEPSRASDTDVNKEQAQA